jgi:phospholipid transport system transporter-binding protein
MTEECTLEFKPDSRILLLGALTFKTCTRLYRTMQGHLDSGRYPAEIDLAGVSTVDSAGLALLLEWQSVCTKAGKALSVEGAPDSLLELARLCGAEKRLQLSGREAA